MSWLTLEHVDDYAPSFISRLRHSKSIVSWRSLADVSGIAILFVRMGAQVRFMPSDLCLVADMLSGRCCSRGHLFPPAVEHRPSCGRYYHSHVPKPVRPEYHDRNSDAASSPTIQFDDGSRPG